MPSLKGTFDPKIGLIIRIGVAKPNSFGFQQAGPPNVERVDALLDTGASRTCVTAEVARRVGLPVIGKRPITSVHGKKSVNWYDADLLLFFDEPHGRSDLTSETQLVEFVSGSPHFEALLGRDVLCKCDFRMTKDHQFFLTS